MNLQAVISLALIPSCVPVIDLPGSDAISEAGSVLFVLFAATDEVEIIAIDAPVVVPRVSLTAADHFYALTYSHPLRSMSIAPGQVPIVEDEPARALPSGYAALRLEDRAWNEADASIADVRIRGFNIGDCEERGGCFLLPSGTPSCELPCPSLPSVKTPLPPLPPEDPVFLPCPDGWATSEERCTPIEQQCSTFLGEADCIAAAGECPASDWPALPPGSVPFYVDPTAPTGGNGTETAPFRTIEEALSTNLEQPIALHKGQHTLNATISQSLVLIGACRETVVTGSILLEGAATISQLRWIAGDDGLRISPEGSLALDHVEIEGQPNVPTIVVNGTLSASYVHLTGGEGLELAGASQTSMRKVRLEDTTSGVLVKNTSTATITDFWMSDADAGLSLGESTHVDLDRAFFQRISGNAVNVAGNALLSGKRISIHAAGELEEAGIDVYGGRLVGEMIQIAGRRYHGLHVRSEGEVAIEDLLVTDCQQGGLYADNHAVVQLKSAQFVSNEGFGLTIHQSEAQLDDVSISDTRNGIVAATEFESTEVRFARLSVTTSSTAIQADMSSIIAGSDITVNQVELGIEASASELDLERVQISEVGTIGITLSKTEATITDASVEHTGEVGIWLRSCNVQLERLSTEHTNLNALRLLSTEARVFDATISDNASSSNAESHAGIYLFGDGSSNGLVESTLLLDRAHLSNAQNAGLTLNRWAQFEANRTVITRCPVGIRVIRPSFDLGEALGEQVLLIDNDRNVWLP